MPGIVVVGLQWGDEGKGKIVDRLSERAFHIVRSQGGSNAGHTIQVGEKTIALHLIPSGALHPQAHLYIAGGCLLDPASLVGEIERLCENGVDLSGRLHISPYCHLIFPYHQLIDGLIEEAKGEHAVGTTRKGIGPCVEDRAARVGLRVADLMKPEHFIEKIAGLVKNKNAFLKGLFSKGPLDLDELTKDYLALGEKLAPYVMDVEKRIHDALVMDQAVLFEGAHGTLLDQLYGSYPYVTSSAVTTAGICAGAAVSPAYVDEVVGILKAYTTRVGEGPLPTALSEDELTVFTSKGDVREVGTTTGRARRLGWLDLVLARYASRINGVTNLVLTKLDVLDHLAEIKLCVGYTLDGEMIDAPPPLSEDLARVEPVYETFPGWQQSTQAIRSVRKLPNNARKLIDVIEDFCHVAVAMVSVGPSRDETIEIDEEWM